MRTSSRQGSGAARRRPLRAASRLALAAVAAAAIAQPLAAQVPTLDRVDSLVASGDYTAARATLERWWSARQEFEVPGSDRPRALMLRAQLAPDPATAEPDYLAIVLGYPTSPHAPEALLRLGQGLLAAGDAGRAAAYLQRLVVDYPGRSQHGLGLLWLARAHSATRRFGAACQAASEGLADARDPDLAAMFRVEQAAACGVAANEAEAAAPATQPTATAASTDPPRPAPQAAEQPPRPRPQPAEASAGRYAVQVGAFRYQRSIDELLPKLREAGHDPRVVLVPRNALMRVRIGRFATAEQAERTVAALKRQGFDAVTVSDADQERSP